MLTSVCTSFAAAVSATPAELLPWNWQGEGGLPVPPGWHYSQPHMPPASKPSPIVHTGSDDGLLAYSGLAAVIVLGSM